jgi:KRAB domain-containing zinc finger protein
VCDVCKKRFTLLHHLKLHRHSHTGKKPYECDICKQLFSRPESLSRHKRTHTWADFPYMYGVCEWRFIYSGEMD